MQDNDCTSGAADEEEDSDREEAVAPIGVNDDNVKIETAGTRGYANVAPQRRRRRRAYSATGERDWGYRYDYRSSGGGCLNAYAKN